MNFTKTLLQYLQRQGYAPASDTEPLIRVREFEDRICLIGIVPERLPGQKETPVADMEAAMQKRASNLMVMQGKQVETLILMAFRGVPEDRIVDEINRYDNIWVMDISNGKLMIYENQRASFGNPPGLQLWLDDFLGKYVVVAEDRKKYELKRVFTPLNTLLVVLNILVFVILAMLGDTEDPAFMAEHGAMYYYGIVVEGKYYLMLTSMFLHFGLVHLTENMFMLVLVGNTLERMMGKTRYGIIYLLSGIGSSIFSLFFTLIPSPSTASAGASGAIFGVMGGILFLVIKDLVTKKKTILKELSIGEVIWIIVIGLGYGFIVNGVDNAAHLGGLLCGFVITAVLSLIRKEPAQD